jgi:hypothetical protein
VDLSKPHVKLSVATKINAMTVHALWPVPDAVQMPSRLFTNFENVQISTEHVLAPARR